MDNNNKEYFEFLDDLRDGGTVNMFGASVDLREEFGLGKSEARKILSQWMDTYDERHPE